MSFPLLSLKACSHTRPNTPADFIVFQSQSSLCCSYSNLSPFRPLRRDTTSSEILSSSLVSRHLSAKKPHRVWESQKGTSREAAPSCWCLSNSSWQEVAHQPGVSSSSVPRNRFIPSLNMVLVHYQALHGLNWAIPIRSNLTCTRGSGVNRHERVSGKAVLCLVLSTGFVS